MQVECATEINGGRQFEHPAEPQGTRAKRATKHTFNEMQNTTLLPYEEVLCN